MFMYNKHKEKQKKLYCGKEGKTNENKYKKKG